MNRSPDEVRAELLAERDATIRLFETAQAHLTAVQPEGLREPLRWFFRAKVEECRSHSSVLGLRVTYAIDMANAIATAGGTKIELSTNPQVAPNTGE